MVTMCGEGHRDTSRTESQEGQTRTQERQSEAEWLVRGHTAREQSWDTDLGQATRPPMWRGSRTQALSQQRKPRRKGDQPSPGAEHGASG